MTAGGWEVEVLSKKEKGHMDMDGSMVIAEGRGYNRLNGNGEK